MSFVDHNLHLKIVLILTFGFALASIFGYFSHRIKMSPILGYLLAGYVIGPFSPGFVADLEIAEQLAEVGVMLMMFGVGLHFKLQDLIDVKNIAIPGAIAQTSVSAMAGAFAMYFMNGSWQTGLMVGLAVGVASTVVLVRVLHDQNLLHTKEGHIAVGWLIVEDILTVVVLILLPIIAEGLKGSDISFPHIVSSMALVFFKFVLLAAIMFTLGKKLVSFALLKISQTRSQELFTLTILALIFVIATGSAFLFGTSIALGAFIAGMVIGQTDVRHKASAYASPLKDAFVVIFFLSVGMLFNPAAIVNHFYLFLSILSIILVIKPLTAFLITVFLRYPAVVALTAALALAQIGEFSFILAEEAGKFNIFPDEAYDVIVACALISISLNPLLFQIFNYLKPFMATKQKPSIQKKLSVMPQTEYEAIVIGYGIVGKEAVRTLEKIGLKTLIVDHDMNTVAKLINNGREAIYGEASFPNMLEVANIESAKLLVITIPELHSTYDMIQFAKERHPTVYIVARARHSEELGVLMEAGVEFICCDDIEVSHAFAKTILKLMDEMERQKTEVKTAGKEQRPETEEGSR